MRNKQTKAPPEKEGLLFAIHLEQKGGGEGICYLVPSYSKKTPRTI